MNEKKEKSPIGTPIPTREIENTSIESISHFDSKIKYILQKNGGAV